MLECSYGRILTLFERSFKCVDLITGLSYDLASELTCLGDYTNVFQLDSD